MLRAMARPVFLAILLVGMSSPALASPSLSALWLPSRASAPEARQRLAHVATSIAARLEASTPSPASIDLRDPLARAKSLMISGAVDEAATLLDQTIERALHALAAINDASAPDLIALHIRRASVALARGEVGRARMLIGRLYRWDPALSFAPSEDTPPMRAMLDQLRRELGKAPPLEQTDLGDLCRTDVVIAGRKLGDVIELRRFDRCVASAEVSLGASDPDDLAIRALGQAALSLPTAVTRTVARPGVRAMKIAGPITLAVGVALLSAGGYFAGNAASRASAIEDGCTAAQPCTNAQVASWANDYATSKTTASVLIPLSVAALVSGTVVTILGFRKRVAF